jgi:hypothetical protein
MRLCRDDPVAVRGRQMCRTSSDAAMTLPAVGIRIASSSGKHFLRLHAAGRPAFAATEADAMYSAVDSG